MPVNISVSESASEIVGTSMGWHRCKWRRRYRRGLRLAWASVSMRALVWVPVSAGIGVGDFVGSCVGVGRH